MSEDTPEYGRTVTAFDGKSVESDLERRVRELYGLFVTMQENMNDLCAQMNELEAKANMQGRSLLRGHKAWKKCKERLAALEAKQAEAATVLSGTFDAAAQAACPDCECMVCGDPFSDHYTDGLDWHGCNNTERNGNLCACSGFRKQTAEMRALNEKKHMEAPAVTVKPEQTAGPVWLCKCGNYTSHIPGQSYPDGWVATSPLDGGEMLCPECAIEEAPAVTTDEVCANPECGHDATRHRSKKYASENWCDGGTLGKPCNCLEYKPVA